MTSRHFFVCTLLALCSVATVVSEESRVKIVSTQPLSSVQWHPSGKQVTYVRGRVHNGTPYSVLFGYDFDADAEKTLYDPLVGETLNTGPGVLNGFVWSPDGNALMVSHQSNLWYVALPDGSAKKLISNDPDVELKSFSADGKRIAFVKQNNLFVIDVAKGAIRQITFDGSESVLNGKLDWVYGEELNEANPSGRAYAWSPDSKLIAFLRLDQSKVPEYPIVDFLQTHPTIRKQRYPKAGDPNSVADVCIADLDDALTPPPVHRLSRRKDVEYILPELTWTPDSKSLAIMALSRAQNVLSLLAWTPAVGNDARLIIEEKDSAWINVYDGPHFLKTAEPNAAATGFGVPFVWLSERDGWLHAYLYGADGSLVRQVTKGAWMIAPNTSRAGTALPVQVDGAGEWMYFSATEKDPRERHLYRSKLDGSLKTPERLSREDGWHFQRLSPDGKTQLESFSSIEQPPITRILKSDGTVIVNLQQSGGVQKNTSADYHEVSAPNGTKLYGRMIRPPNFNPETKYPVIVDVYGGPGIQLVRNAWGVDDWLDQRLAMEGFVIWKMDNRGSFGRGHDWEKAIFKNMGASELSDQLAGVDYLKKLPFVDPERIGVHGWSYGGYMTLYMLTHSPETFKCGASGAPVTDWKFYDSIYTERYMRTPNENPKGYAAASPLLAAGDLTAKLMLIHGTADDNVHMQNTMNFLDALTKKGRSYELQIQPGQKHGFHGERAWQYLTDKMIDFFKRNL